MTQLLASDALVATGRCGPGWVAVEDGLVVDQGVGAAPPGARHLGPRVLRVESAFALDVQHMLPVLIERINVRYGWRCVEKIVLKQGPVEHKVRVQPVASPNAETIHAAEARVGAVEDEGLRAALVKWGAGVLMNQQANKKPE